MKFYCFNTSGIYVLSLPNPPKHEKIGRGAKNLKNSPKHSPLKLECLFQDKHPGPQLIYTHKLLHLLELVHLDRKATLDPHRLFRRMFRLPMAPVPRLLSLDQVLVQGKESWMKTIPENGHLLVVVV